MLATARVGATTLHVRHDVAGAGWKVGDRIGVAPTAQMGKGHGECFTIASISAHATGKGAVIGLQGQLAEDKLGKTSVIAGRQVHLAAEVVLLTRTVEITGPPFTMQTSTHSQSQAVPQGLHVIQMGAGQPSSGYMHISYTRVSNCGQRGFLGRYCLHFHHVSHCPRCRFEGNAVEDGEQRGITIHGTHDAMVKDNVVWNVKGSNLYIEDGQERNNTLQGNVAVCPNPWGGPSGGCTAPGTDNQQADTIQQSGIWAISASNHFIGNRCANHRNGLFLQSTAFVLGRNSAQGKVRPMHSRFGTIRGNVFHSNQRFGFYPDSNYPRNLQYTEDGELSLASASMFTEDGLDNGQAPYAVVEDGLDWHNDLMGQYALGDVQYRNHVSVNNLVNLYWKTTKNFVDGMTPHLKGCVFAYSASYVDGLPRHMTQVPHCLVKGPGGHGTFGIEDTHFISDAVLPGAAVCASQHCGLPGAGSLCAPTYSLSNTHFSPNSGLRFLSGISSGRADLETLTTFSSLDTSVSGSTPGSVVRTAMAHIAGDTSCRPSTLAAKSVFCTKQARRLYIWSEHIGDVTLTSDAGATYTMKYQELAGESGKMRKGYAAPVLAGEHYTVGQAAFNTNLAVSPVAIEFSDTVFGTKFTPGTSDTLRLTFRFTTGGKDVDCVLRSSDDRAFIGVDGPFDWGRGSCVSELGLPRSQRSLWWSVPTGKRPALAGQRIAFVATANEMQCQQQCLKHGSCTYVLFLPAHCELYSTCVQPSGAIKADANTAIQVFVRKNSAACSTGAPVHATTTTPATTGNGADLGPVPVTQPPTAGPEGPVSSASCARPTAGYCSDPARCPTTIPYMCVSGPSIRGCTSSADHWPAHPSSCTACVNLKLCGTPTPATVPQSVTDAPATAKPATDAPTTTAKPATDAPTIATTTASTCVMSTCGAGLRGRRALLATEAGAPLHTTTPVAPKPTTTPATTTTANPTPTLEPTATPGRNTTPNPTATLMPTTGGSPQPASDCHSVWNVMAGEYTCGARITYIKGLAGHTQQSAEGVVSKEFPAECGACDADMASGNSAPAPAPPSIQTFPGGSITIEGRLIKVGGAVLRMKGVCWNAVPKGGTHPPTPGNVLKYARTDAPLMQAAGINVVRPYATIEDHQALDVFLQHGIHVIQPIDPFKSSVALSQIGTKISFFKLHVVTTCSTKSHDLRCVLRPITKGAKHVSNPEVKN